MNGPQWKPEWNDVIPTVEYITPEMAEQYLQHNFINRVINWKRVNEYVYDILTDRWSLNGETVVFSKSGWLRDGQHRLWAIVKANKGAPVVVVRGVDDEITLFDRGRSRSITDTLSIEGYDKSLVSKTNIAICKLHYLRQLGISNVSDSKCKEFLEEHANSLICLRQICAKHHDSGTARLSCSIAALLLAGMYALESGEKIEDLTDFAEVYRTGMYSNEGQKAAIVCRNDVISKNIRVGAGGQTERLLALRIYERAIYDFCRRTPRTKTYKNTVSSTYSGDERFKESKSGLTDRGADRPQGEDIE